MFDTRPALRHWGLFILPFAAACGQVPSASAPNDTLPTQPDAGVPAIPDSGVSQDASQPFLEAITISPVEHTLEEDGQPPYETFRFSAIGTFSNGERDISDAVEWSLDRPALGTLEGGVFMSTGTGGLSNVTARLGDTEVTAKLKVILKTSGIDPILPPDDATRFPDDMTNDRQDVQAPLIVYPACDTMFPLNIQGVVHQWTAPLPFELYEVRLTSEVADIRFVTAEQQLQFGYSQWRQIALTHAGRSLEMVVRAILSNEPGVVYRSLPITLSFADSEAQGEVYYWSTEQQGVMRSSLERRAAESFYTPSENTDEACVGCHTVARNGRRMAMGYGSERLRAITMPDRQTLQPAYPNDEDRKYGWGTFNPAADKLLFASSGRLVLWDIDGGSEMTSVDLPHRTRVTQPDWSPNGAWVVVALRHTRHSLDDQDFEGTSLARIPVLPGGGFGAPEVILESANFRDTLYFPTFSPDSQWVAFVRGRGKSKDNHTSELYLMRADGSTPPILLETLNRTVGVEDNLRNLGNSMPTWAPSTQPGINWLAFSSLRDYGLMAQGIEKDQLWVSAIDLAIAAEGNDPSAPAFWLPFQTIGEGNHRAFWAQSEDDWCFSSEEMCDNLDNDCDGLIDEDCCMFDSDSEQCICAGSEICGNGFDDDCDGQVDADDDECTD